MKHLRNLFLSAIVVTGIGLNACNNKSATEKNDTSKDTVTITNPTTPAPVEIGTDEALKNGIQDATKDYPTVNASVSNGEITLTGEIQKDRLPQLLQALNSLHPKKINNNLTIK